MLSAKCVPKWKDVEYGVPHPRFIRPLVRINGHTEDAPEGYVIDPCFLPPTVLQLDECDMTLRVNDALLDLNPLLPCFKVAASDGPPVNPPSAGYLPFNFDVTNSQLYVYAGGVWHKSNP
jgi:hypothetical protein